MSRACAVHAILVAVAIVAVARPVVPGAAWAATGEENFNKTCAACHTVGGGRLVGPDLKGVTERRDEAWLVRFIKSSQSLVRAGDPAAVALFDEFKIPMPDAPYGEAEIREIIAFLRARSGAGDGAAAAGAAGSPAAAVVAREATPEVVRLGQDLFQGITRLENGGASCNSCHHVRNDAVIGGGVLARDLTAVFGRMGANGIQAILGTPPFPVMERAYRTRPITEEEQFALIAFLKDADAHQAFQQPRDYGFKLLYSGLIGFVGLMALYATVWRRRKTRAVNHAVFERQVRTR